jgi:hypothetical protein
MAARVKSGKTKSGSATHRRSRAARKAAATRRRATERLRAAAKRAAATRGRRRRRGGARRTSAARTASGGMSQKKRDSLDASQYAFPKQRKEPLNDAKHVRNAIARFDQVDGVSDKQRDKAWRRIKKAAKKYGVDVSAKSWRQLGKKNKKGKSGTKSST